MSIQNMKLAYLAGFYDDLDHLCESIIDRDYFHVENTCEVMSGNKGLIPINDENPFSSWYSRLTEVINEFGIVIDDKPYKKSLAINQLESYLQEVETKLKDIHSKREEYNQKVNVISDTIKNLSHFSSIDVPLKDINSTEFVKVRLGRLPKASTEKLNIYSDNPFVKFFVISAEGEYDWGMYFKPHNDDKDVDRIFQSLYFEPAKLPNEEGSPMDIIAQLEKQQNELQENLQSIEEDFALFVEDHKKSISKLYKQTTAKYKSFELKRYAARFNSSYLDGDGIDDEDDRDYFLFVCWVPEDKCKEFDAYVTKKVPNILIEFTKPESLVNMIPPTKLKNNRLFRPFQYYVEIYGMPNYRELDPTIFVAITYTLLYGIMFADLGQGIVLAIAGFLMHKFMKMPIGKILIPCGLCGAVFGVIFGSFFGFEEVFNPLYKAIGVVEEGKPIEVMHSATSLLAVSIGIGVVLMLMALILSICSKFKQNDLGEAIFGHNGICGFVLYFSAILIVLSILGWVKLPIIPVLVVGIIVPLILIFLELPFANLLKGRGFDFEQGIGEYILENIFELFEVVLSYFTNTLSFLRVGAFVLIHAGMMNAFFALAAIMGKGSFMYWFMLVFGNVFVLALEGLLVGIQVLRLEFYEMFSRFYEGDGKTFSPFKKEKI